MASDQPAHRDDRLAQDFGALRRELEAIERFAEAAQDSAESATQICDLAKRIAALKCAHPKGPPPPTET